MPSMEYNFAQTSFSLPSVKKVELTELTPEMFIDHATGILAKNSKQNDKDTVAKHIQFLLNNCEMTARQRLGFHGALGLADKAEDVSVQQAIQNIQNITATKQELLIATDFLWRKVQGNENMELKALIAAEKATEDPSMLTKIYARRVRCILSMDIVEVRRHIESAKKEQLDSEVVQLTWRASHNFSKDLQPEHAYALLEEVLPTLRRFKAIPLSLGPILMKKIDIGVKICEKIQSEISMKVDAKSDVTESSDYLESNECLDAFAKLDQYLITLVEEVDELLLLDGCES